MAFVLPANTANSSLSVATQNVGGLRKTMFANETTRRLQIGTGRELDLQPVCVCVSFLIMNGGTRKYSRHRLVINTSGLIFGSLRFEERDLFGVTCLLVTKITKRITVKENIVWKPALPGHAVLKGA